jgi:hypothetical protein
VAVGDVREVVVLVGDVGVVGVMQPFVPATLGQPDCVGSVDVEGAEGEKVFAFGIPVAPVFCGA